MDVTTRPPLACEISLTAFSDPPRCTGHWSKSCPRGSTVEFCRSVRDTPFALSSPKDLTLSMSRAQEDLSWACDLPVEVSLIWITVLCLSSRRAGLDVDVEPCGLSFETLACSVPEMRMARRTVRAERHGLAHAEHDSPSESYLSQKNIQKVEDWFNNALKSSSKMIPCALHGRYPLGFLPARHARKRVVKLTPPSHTQRAARCLRSFSLHRRCRPGTQTWMQKAVTSTARARNGTQRQDDASPR